MELKTKALVVKIVLAILLVTCLLAILKISFIDGRDFPGFDAVYIVGLVAGCVTLFTLSDKQVLISGLVLLGVALVIPGPVAAAIYLLIKKIVPSVPDYVMPLLVPFTLIAGIVVLWHAHKMNKELRGSAPRKEK